MGEISRGDRRTGVFRSEPCAATAGAERPVAGLCGQVLPGDYRLLELLGEDDTCTSYRALQLVLGREVAIEVLRPELCASPASRARFMIQARVASRLKHPCTVELLDFGHTFARQPYVVKELVRGIDLGRLQREHGPLPQARVLGLIEQVASALIEAHALGVVHGDLRPENVIVRELASGQDLVKVIDFALAPASERADVAADLEALAAMRDELLESALAPEPLERELMGCPSCTSCVPIARHCCDCGRPLVLSSLTVPRGRACA
jgi:serine/threonine-protein kinase